MRLCLGPRAYDVATRALVAGVVELDEGAPAGAVVARAEELAGAGADVVEVVVDAPGGAVLDLAQVVGELAARLPVAVAVSTPAAAVARAAFEAGAAVAVDRRGTADDDWLEAAAAAGASVVLAGGTPSGGEELLLALARRAEAAGLPPEGIVLSAGLDLAGSAALGAAGHPLGLAATPADVAAALPWAAFRPREAALAAVAVAVTRGWRLVRVADVRGARRVCDTIAAVLEAA